MPQSPKILILQSHDDTRELYTAFLRHTGFTPLPVSTTDEGLQHAASVDAIVTGVGVVGSMDGLELVRRVRQNEDAVRTPIIVLTAYPFEIYHEQAFAAGCDVFLTKPCAPDTLSRELRRLLALARVPKPLSARVNGQRERHQGGSSSLAVRGESC